MAKNNKKEITNYDDFLKEINNCNSALDYTIKCNKYIKYYIGKCINFKENDVKPQELLEHLLRCAYWTPNNVVVEKDSRKQKTRDKLTERLDKQNKYLSVFEQSILGYYNAFVSEKNDNRKSAEIMENQFENLFLQDHIIEKLRKIYGEYLKSLLSDFNSAKFKENIEKERENLKNNFFANNVNNILRFSIKFFPLYPILPLFFFLVMSKRKTIFCTNDINCWAEDINVSYIGCFSYTKNHYDKQFFAEDLKLFMDLHKLLFLDSDSAKIVQFKKDTKTKSIRLMLPSMKIPFIDKLQLSYVVNSPDEEIFQNCYVKMGFSKSIEYEKANKSLEEYCKKKECNTLLSVCDLFTCSVYFAFKLKEECFKHEHIAESRKVMIEAINIIYNSDLIKKNNNSAENLSDSQKLKEIYKHLNPRYYDINLLCFFFVTRYSQNKVDNLCDEDTLKKCKGEKLLERAYKKEFRRLYKPKTKKLRSELNVKVPKSKLKDSANEREIIELKLAISKSWDRKDTKECLDFKDTEDFINKILTLNTEKEKSQAYQLFFLEFMEKLSKTEKGDDGESKFKLNNRSKLATQIIYYHACVQFIWQASHGLETETLQSLNDLFNCIYTLRE